MVTVYSKNGCSQCHQTMEWLKDKGIGFSEVNVSTHPEKVNELKSKGVRRMPYVVTESDSWQGLRPDKLMTLAS